MKPKIKIASIDSGAHINGKIYVTLTRYDGARLPEKSEESQMGYENNFFTGVTLSSARRVMRAILNKPIFGDAK